MLSAGVCPLGSERALLWPTPNPDTCRTRELHKGRRIGNDAVDAVSSVVVPQVFASHGPNHGGGVVSFAARIKAGSVPLGNVMPVAMTMSATAMNF
jgi:hypothetical protein